MKKKSLRPFLNWCNKNLARRLSLSFFNFFVVVWLASPLNFAVNKILNRTEEAGLNWTLSTFRNGRLEIEDLLYYMQSIYGIALGLGLIATLVYFYKQDIGRASK